MKAPFNPLTWSLVIPTYKREHILPLCLRLAANQTRAPMEVVVVDASPDWEATRALIAEEFAGKFPNVSLIYVQARTPSSTAQRNQGIELANGDILFLIDDDSLMYPDCAEEVMKIYEADHNEAIQGVSAISVSERPLEAPHEEILQGLHGVAQKPKQTKLRKLIKRLLAAEDTYFLPYDDEYPDKPIPEHLHSMNIGRIRLIPGYSMTFRRKVLLKERFSEVLLRYAAGEDQDLSYRVSRHGAIVNAINARLCHLEISGGRLSQFHVAALAALNPAVLQKLYCCTEIERMQRKWRALLKRRALINFLKDLSEKRFCFQRTRGVLFALAHTKDIYSRTPETLLGWYPEFQKKILSVPNTCRKIR